MFNKAIIAHYYSSIMISNNFAINHLLALLASVMINPASSLIIFFTATTGIVLGIKDLPSKSKNLALAGIIINAIVLPLGLASMGIRIDLPPQEIRPPEKLAPPGIGAILNEKGFYEIVHPADKSIMVSIPAGEFTMGSDKKKDEKPVQQIYLDHYYIDKYHVTNEKFEKFVDETGYVTDAEKIGPNLGRSFWRPYRVLFTCRLVS